MSAKRAAYRTSEAAQAANLPQKTIRQCLDRHVVKLRGNDTKPLGSGSYVGLSRNRVYQFAIMERLTSVGVSAAKAAEAAVQFSDVGDSVRPAAELFPIGRTLLVITPSSPPRVMNSDYDASLASISATGASVIVVDLNQLVADVDTTLNQFENSR